MKTYRVWSLDIWGNEEDGWDMNDRSEIIKALAVPGEQSDANIVKALIGAGLLKPSALKKGAVHIDGEAESMYIEDASNGYPMFQLELNTHGNPAAKRGSSGDSANTHTQTGGSSPGGASTGGVGSGIGGAGTGGAATGGASTGGAGAVTITISGYRDGKKVRKNPASPLQERVFKFLEALRKSGETNMYGAAPYLESKFGFDRREAREWLTKWMNSYSKNPINISIHGVGGPTRAGNVASGSGPGAKGSGGRGRGSGGGGGGAAPDEPWSSNKVAYKRNPLSRKEAAFIFRTARKEQRLGSRFAPSPFKSRQAGIATGLAMAVTPFIRHSSYLQAKRIADKIHSKSARMLGNPLTPYERALINREAAAHERDSREHRTCRLRTFDAGTAAGMREAVAIAGGGTRRNPDNSHREVKKGERVGISMWHSAPGKGLSYQPMTATMLEDGFTGGWDVWDVRGLDGRVYSVYGFSIYKLSKRNPMSARGQKFVGETHALIARVRAIRAAEKRRHGARRGSRRK